MLKEGIDSLRSIPCKYETQVRVRGDTLLMCKSTMSKKTLKPNATQRTHAVAEAMLYELHLDQASDSLLMSCVTIAAYHPLNVPGGHLLLNSTRINIPPHAIRHAMSTKSIFLMNLRAAFQSFSIAKP